MKRKKEKNSLKKKQNSNINYTHRKRISGQIVDEIVSEVVEAFKEFELSKREVFSLVSNYVRENAELISQHLNKNTTVSDVVDIIVESVKEQLDEKVKTTSRTGR